MKWATPMPAMVKWPRISGCVMKKKEGVVTLFLTWILCVCITCFRSVSVVIVCSFCAQETMLCTSWQFFEGVDLNCVIVLHQFWMVSQIMRICCEARSKQFHCSKWLLDHMAGKIMSSKTLDKESNEKNEG